MNRREFFAAPVALAAAPLVAADLSTPAAASVFPELQYPTGEQIAAMMRNNNSILSALSDLGLIHEGPFVDLDAEDE